MAETPLSPTSAAGFSGDTARLVSECWTNGTDCESCGNRHARVVLRSTNYGHACLVLCSSCRQAPEPLRLWTSFAVNDHRQHITRALDAADPRRETS